MHPRDAWINRFEIVERYLIDLRSSLQLISSLDLYFVVSPEMRYSSGIFTVVASFLSITLILKVTTVCVKFCVDVFLQLVASYIQTVTRLTKKARPIN